MSLLTPTQMRVHIENDLDDTELQRIIDSVEEEMVDKYGPHTTQTDELDESRLSNVLFLSRRASAIVTVTEEYRAGGDVDSTVLSADDYDLTEEGERLRRLSSGTNPASTWGDTVIVTYTPRDETSKREGVLIAMVKLDVQFQGLEAEKGGDFQSQQENYEKNRNNALGRLQQRMGLA